MNKGQFIDKMVEKSGLSVKDAQMQTLMTACRLRYF